jgi:hypothetical protein
MTRQSPTCAKRQKSPPIKRSADTDNSIGKCRSGGHWFDAVIDELTPIFPRKLAFELAMRAGRPKRVVELWLEGRAAPNGEALASLIRSDVGDRVLLALTAGCSHPWADNVRATHEIARLRKQQAESARRLAELERGIR